MRPLSRVVTLALKVIEAFYLRPIRHRQTSGGEYDVTRRPRPAIFGLQAPGCRFIIERRLIDTSVKVDVRLEFKPFRDMLGVAQNFRLRRVFLRPVPLLGQRRVKLIRVLHTFNVAPRAWISIPIPGTTDTIPSLDHPSGQPELTKSMKRVHTGEPGAYNNNVKLCRAHTFTRFSFDACTFRYIQTNLSDLTRLKF